MPKQGSSRSTPTTTIIQYTSDTATLTQIPFCLFRRIGRMLSAEIKLGKLLDRRAFKACHHCSVGKRQCENARPCEACCSRGLACREAQKDVSSWRCTCHVFDVRV